MSLTLTFPNNLLPGTTYWKYGVKASPNWYTIPSIINGNKLTFTIVDGGPGDDDLIANGRIQDDGSPSIQLAGDLNGNDVPADAGDLVLIKRASIGEITLSS